MGLGRPRLVSAALTLTLATAGAASTPSVAGASTARTARHRASAGAAGRVLASKSAAEGVSTSASASAVSANWAGYVAVPSASARFSSVSGSWTIPRVSCQSGREGHSAAWVGLGGDGETASALEQIGTDADCSRSGSAAYSAWYELVPSGPVDVALRLHAGDAMSGSVTVRGHDVTLRMRDLTTGARFGVTRDASSIDVASAEWIVEAPSACLESGGCSTLTLTDFGSMSFSSATAIAAGHTGTIADPGWSATELELRQSAGRDLDFGRGRRFGPSSGLITAAPSTFSPADGSFTVSWQETPVDLESPSQPAVPGLGAGAAA